MLVEWCDDDGIVTFEKSRLFGSFDEAVRVAYDRFNEFVKTSEQCEGIDIPIPPIKEFLQTILDYGYFCLMAYEGSSDYRRYYRIETITQSIELV